MKLAVLFFALFFSTELLAQSNNENISIVSVNLDTDDEIVKNARFYKEARENIKVEFTKLVFKNGKTSFGKKYLLGFDKNKNAWNATLPYGTYNFRTSHIGFVNHNQTLEIDQPLVMVEKNIAVEELPYSFENGKKYNYIKGGVEFSETIVIHFKGGSIEENKTFLEGFPHENIQKLKFVNSFLLTLNLSNQESLAEILIRETHNDPVLNEGFYLGDAITKTIEKISENPNVKYANPTFVYPKNSITTLSLKDYSNISGLRADLKSRQSDEPKRINPDDFEQSDALKLKLLNALEGN